MTTTVTQQGVRDRHVTVPRSSAGQAARLSFDNGLSHLDLQAGEPSEHLLEAWFTDPLPLVWAAAGGVHVEYPLGARLRRPADPNTIRLNPHLPWSVDVHGGAAHLHADLTGVDVRSVAVHAGVAHTRLVLDRPAGPCTIRLTSVKDLHLQRPGDVPVRIEVAKGATEVTLDGRSFGAVGGGLADQTPGYDSAEARYLLLVSGGAATLTVA